MTDDAPTPDRPGVSVVVPAHNAAVTLETCIRALLASDDAIAEIIIADDASDDAEPARMLELDPRVSVVRTGDRPVGPASARNTAASRATSEVIVFVDADVRVHPGTVGTLIEPMRTEPGVVACFGSYDDDPPAKAAASLYANLRHHSVHQAAPADGATFWSGLGAVRRSAFDAAGGFDAGFGKPSIEDVELGTRLREQGGVIRVVHGAQATHMKAWTASGLWRTDVFARAIPWARLSVDRPELLASLNAGPREKLAALGVAAALAALLLVWFLPGPIALAAVAAGVAGLAWWAWHNRRLLHLLRLRGGVRALLIGGVLHAVYYVYSSAIYVLGGAAFGWRACWAGRRGSTVLWSIAFLGLFAGGSVCLLLAIMNTETLLDGLMRLERDPTRPRYSLETLPVVQQRLGWFGAVLLGAAATMLVVTPRWFANELAGLRTILGEWRRQIGSRSAVLGAFTLLLALLAGMQLNQPMRLDESSSYAMYATTSPLVALMTYDTPNNHVLNSALMWASVRAFGPDPWAVRLPAYLFTLMLPMLLYLAGRAVFGGSAALLAAGISAAAVYSTELATNGRGYPIVACCFLLLLAVMPMLAARKPGATVIAIAAGMVGLYAVPIMAYPLGVVYTAAATHAVLTNRSVRSIPALAAAGALTCACAGLLYMPSWVTTAGPSAVAVLQRVPTTAEPAGLFNASTLRYNVLAAAAQFVYPLPARAGFIALGVILLGAIGCLARRGVARAFAVGLLLGVPAVFAVSGFKEPPWWAFAWAWPVFLLLLAAIIAWASGAIVRRVHVGPVALAAAAAIVVGGSAVISDYPADTPHWVGYRDAPAVADTLIEMPLEDAHIVAAATIFRPLTFELNTRGVGGRPVTVTHELAHAMRPTVIRVIGDPGMKRPTADRFVEPMAERLDLERTMRVGESTIEIYRVRSEEQ